MSRWPRRIPPDASSGPVGADPAPERAAPVPRRAGTPGDVDHLQVDWAAQDGVALVYAAGEIDRDSAPQLRAAVDAALRTDPAVLHFDMSAVTFCDSSGLHVLVRARRLSTESGGAVTVTSSSAVTRLFDITGTTALFPDRAPRAVAPVDGPGGTADES